MHGTSNLQDTKLARFQDSGSCPIEVKAAPRQILRDACARKPINLWKESRLEPSRSYRDAQNVPMERPRSISTMPLCATLLARLSDHNRWMPYSVKASHAILTEAVDAQAASPAARHHVCPLLCVFKSYSRCLWRSLACALADRATFRI